MRYSHFFLCLASLFLCITSVADEIYRAEYTGQYRGLNVTTYRSLNELKPGQFQYRFHVDHALAKLDESSDFIFSTKGELLPLRYIMEKKVFGFTTTEKLSFDWEQKIASYSHSKKKKRNGTVALKPGILDPLLHQLALQEDLSRSDTTLDYHFIKRTSNKNYLFERVSEENIDVGGETYSAILIERSNIKESKNLQMWFVPALDYQLGKIRYQEKDGDEYELRLVKYTVEPERLQQWRDSREQLMTKQ